MAREATPTRRYELEFLRPKHQEANIEVLNLSFPRCGTASLQAALEILGYKCWHSNSLVGDAAACAAWTRALDAKYAAAGRPFDRADWDRLLRGYTAVSAAPPAAAFAEDLARSYPDARVIVAARDDGWLASFDATAGARALHRCLDAAAGLDPWLLGPLRDVHRRWLRLWFRAASPVDMGARAPAMHAAHVGGVRRVVPAANLLEYRLGSGWAPLCDFLGKDVPPVPFPRRSGRDAWVLRRAAWVFARSLVGAVAPACLLAALGWWIWRIRVL